MGDHAATTARNLLLKAGSLNQLIHNAERIVDDPPIRGLLSAVEEFLSHALLTEVQDRPIISGSEALLNYLKFRMAHLPYEQVRALYLDTLNQVIGDDVVAKGTIASSPVYPREIIRRALELHATGIILVHNHPSGSVTPSSDDIASTRRLQRACSDMDISLLDHIIISREGWSSFKMEGLL